jgi:hypothetical protein
MKSSRLVLALLALGSVHCKPDEPSWQLDAISSMATPTDPPLVCPVLIARDPAASRRDALMPGGYSSCPGATSPVVPWGAS